tara:strand:- start:37 stop:636 length:600 start_codon:yes stop_codon:yes gene_type:complete
MISIVVSVLAECLAKSSTVMGAGGIYYLDGVSVENKFDVGIGTYTFEGVPSAHPLAFVADADDSDDFFMTVSDDAANKLSKMVEGRDYVHYDNTVVLHVLESFDQLSMHCYYHGYMRGQHAIKYNSTCDDETVGGDDDDKGGMSIGAIVALSVFAVGVVGVVGALVYMKLAGDREMKADARAYRREVQLPMVAPGAQSR